MKKVFLFIFLLLFVGMPSKSIEADDSVNDIIQKKYNSSALENRLPKLPKTSPKSIESKNFLDTGEHINNIPAKIKTEKTFSMDNIPKVPQKSANAKAIKVDRWRKVNAKLTTPVSDVSKIGKQISFITVEPLYSKKYVIPKGSTIYGTVLNSHSPQILGNGGLVKIKTEYISYGGTKSYFDGNIVSVKHKHILFNNVKGKNGYTRGVSKAMKPGKTFYKKSSKLAKKINSTPVAILSPVVYLPSVIFLVADGAVSPLLAIFSKGDKVYLPKDTPVTIKLAKPSYIEY